MKRLTILTIVAVSIALIGTPTQAEAQDWPSYYSRDIAFVSGEAIVEIKEGAPIGEMRLLLGSTLGIPSQAVRPFCFAEINDGEQAVEGFIEFAELIGVRTLNRGVSVDGKGPYVTTIAFEVSGPLNYTVFAVDELCSFIQTETTDAGE